MYTNWKSGTTPVSELTLDNFQDFAESYALYAYKLCFKASFDEKQAISLGANALAAVACEESGKEGSDMLMPEEAVKRVLLDILSKQQLARLNNDDFSADKNPDDTVIEAVVNKAVNLANMNMPRYARVFSGTKGALVIIGLVAALVLAIVLIWINPFSCSGLNAGASGSKTGDVMSAARPDVDMLINVDFDDSAAEKINSGAYPVLFSVSGPDSRTVNAVSVVDSDGTEISAYPCGEYKYCFIPTESDVYQIRISSDIGDMSAYHIIPAIEIDEGNAPANKYYAVSHNDVVTIMISEADTITAAPTKGTIDQVLGNYIYTPVEGSDGVGLDMFTYVGADGVSYTVPVLVSNSSPFVGPAALSAEIVHTPSRSGMYAGVIPSSDADGDKIVFELAETTGCSVFLSSDGSYVALIDKDYRMNEASFTFTVSDGIVVSDPYEVRIALSNNLISAAEITREFVCYSGENGYYSFELPAKDDDGDDLVWSLVTENENGLTSQWHSEVTVEDGNIVRYRINPGLDENFVEALTFSCSDGWMSGTLMTVVCSNKANAAPVSSGNNYAEISADSTLSVLEVSVKDDCEFDKCAIVSVDNVYGGSVIENEGWSDMKFSFVPDGNTRYCTVVLTVSDVLTGRSSQIVYDIVVG